MSPRHLAIAFALFSFLPMLSSGQEGFLEISQPIDIVSATITAKRAAAAQGKKVEELVITSARYFGDEALATGPRVTGREKFLREFAEEKGIKTPCWIVNFSQKKITANRVDDYAEMIGVSVFVSSANEAAVVAFQENFEE